MSGESVSLDVHAHFKEKPPPTLGWFTEVGLTSYRFYEVMSGASEQLAEYILASAFCERDLEQSRSIIGFALQTTYQATAGWTNNDHLNGALLVLRVLASIPDQNQNERINIIMQYNESAQAETSPVGLIATARQLFGNRAQQSYTHEVHYAYERYVGYLKELMGLQCVLHWLNENRNLWAWMDRDLFELQHQQAGAVQARGDYSVSRESDGGLPLDHHHHSDSDGMHGMHAESEDEEDEDSRYEEMELFQDGPSQVLVSGAGSDVVNGIYAKDGVFEKACKFSKPCVYEGKDVVFSLFKCNVSNNTKHWYISIVPTNSPPGTSSDVDFYSAPVTEACQELPPLQGWVKAAEGSEPTPVLSFKDLNLNDPDPIPVPPFDDLNENEQEKYI
jgi:ubiquitin carboxyl-terminal hydrolase 9/24